VLRFAGPYEGALRSNLLFLKKHAHVCHRMRERIRSQLKREEELLSADSLIPVPLHPQRLKERGYNQAEVIARLVARAFDRPLDGRSLVRVKHTDPHRAGMDPTARTKSVSNAFDVTEPERVKGMTVLLVDDIYTTGATLNECARVLRKAGAKSIYAFTVARTI
jgi:ComF family protein